MPQIKQIQITNFRGIKDLTWHPNPGLNCLIGSGDSGKSTILDAIELALMAKRNYSFSDADFYQLNISTPIEIAVTLGNLSDKLQNIEHYGSFLRGFNSQTKIVNDEPDLGDEIAITIKLTVDDSLEPFWQLYSERADNENIERMLQWKHRELVTPARLGTSSNFNLAWGNKSILNKLGDENLNVGTTLLKLVREARKQFAQHEIQSVNTILLKVKKIANHLGVKTGDLQALLDVNSFSLSNGAISLHNDDNTPLTQLGTGSTRLLISGLQKSIASSNIFLVDEVEYGLEPYRITRLLHELGSKESNPEQQVFVTTHSPYVLRELKSSQLHILRKPDTMEGSHIIHNLDSSDNAQSTLRVCAEAFFNQSVIVCEGKTEIGLVRGIDLDSQEKGKQSIQANGVYWADGGGGSLFSRAKIFNDLGYRTAIFKDSDVPDVDKTNDARNDGIKIFEWGNNNSFEEALFSNAPSSTIMPLIDYAIEQKGKDSVSTAINKHSNLGGISTIDEKSLIGMRGALGKAAKDKGWFKDIEPAEHLAKKIICPNYDEFDNIFTTVINELFDWAKKTGADAK